MKLEIVTPEKTVFAGEVSSVKLPGTGGSFSILSHHAPLISSLGKGVLTYKPTEGKTEIFQIEGGFVEVCNNQINVCLEKIITADGSTQN